MAKVCVAIPNEYWLHRDLVTRMIDMMVSPTGHEIYFDLKSEKIIDASRNAKIKRFLAGDGDFILFIDSDNPPVRNPLELVDLDKDILAFPTPIPLGGPEDWKIGRPNMYFNCMDEAPNEVGWLEHWPQEGLQEIDAAGTGCMLIARRVLEHPDMRPAFYREWDEDGCVAKGSDYLFCRRAKRAGFKVFAHYDYRCSHFKEGDLLALYKYQWIRDISHANQPNINTPEYWDGQWSKRPERVLPFYGHIVKYLKERGAKKVLDFGCGRGDLLALLDEEFDAYGYDISKKALEICRERGLKTEVFWHGHSYDAIVCTEVLEHLDDDAGQIQDFFRLAPLVIYSVPNNCLPPSVEPEHRRVYKHERIYEISPNVKQILDAGPYLVVVCERSERDGSSQRCVSGVCEPAAH